jgi:hypothetical protein
MQADGQVAMRQRAALERIFLRLCRKRGPGWIESVIRPLRLPGGAITVGDIPMDALEAIVRVFGRRRFPAGLVSETLQRLISGRSGART